MKEFKFCGEMTEYVEIPVMVCETQKEMVNEISEVREVSFNDYVYEQVALIENNRQLSIKNQKEYGYSTYYYDEQIRQIVGTGDETSIYVIYKDGSTYFETFGERQGKFKRYGIKAAVIETAFEYTVYGDFAVTDNGDISIEESDIEEYGVYNGQYDVKEEPEATAETVESVEETTVSETVEETAEQETEINAEVEAEQTAENKAETTAENITVSGTNQDNINVLIVADVINAFEMITHTGYFDTS